MNGHSESDNATSARGENAGWIAGAIVILVVLAIGAAAWFTYHPV